MLIICPACGTNLEVQGDHAWGVLNCVECGKRIRFGEPPKELAEGEIGFDFAARSGPAAVNVPVKPGSEREWRKTILAASVGALVMAMLAMLVLVLQRAMVPAAPLVSVPVPWDQAHRGDLLELKADADSLARQGKWQQSYDAYQKILAFVADHDVKDPVAVAAVGAVQPGQDRTMAALLAQRAAPIPEIPVMIPPVISATPLPMTRPTVAVTEPLGRLLAQSATTAPTLVVASGTPLDAAESAADHAPRLPGAPPPPPSLHAYTLPDAVTDEQIGEAINKGVKYLSDQFQNGEVNTGMRGRPQSTAAVPSFAQPPRGKPAVESDLDKGSELGEIPTPPPAPVDTDPPSSGNVGYQGAASQPGYDALCVYALLNAGRAMDVPGLGQTDPFTEGILERLKSYEMRFTYHRSLRAAALSVFNRTEDNAALEADVHWLQSASVGGGYTYTLPGPGSSDWDNSNSQYGLLGVWSGAQAGQAVSLDYWKQVEAHWDNCALPNGVWSYMAGTGPSPTMTCAGIASLLVAGDYLESADIRRSGYHHQSEILDGGLSWLDQGDNCMSAVNGGWVSYGLYGLERVGLASGFKYFGMHDWYAELAKTLVAEQHLDGSWGGGAGTYSVSWQRLIDSSYSLLFLARGRHPILFNKLRYDGHWNNRPHDVAHLARYAAHQLEQPLNWQVVNLRRNWFDWMDSPVLYISGDKKLDLTERDYQSLQSFANAGGLIFTHADGGSAAFNAWVAQLVRKIFPKYELMQVPRDHPVYSTVYPLKNPAPLLAVSNGSRLLLIDSPTDLAEGWQLDWTSEKQDAFQMGVNVFVYAAGKSNLKNRLASTYIPSDPDKADSTGQIARLQYAGEWDPEPYAYERFSRYFRWETHQALTPVTVQMKSLQPGSQPIAVLTGTVAHDFTDAETAAAKAYVSAGGVLLIDACGGQQAFVKSVEQTLLPKAFAGEAPVPIASNHPVLLPSRSHADDLVRPMLRGYAVENGGKDLPVETIAFGRGWVIFSRLDLTTGLLGTQSWGILGYSSAYAQALVKNAVLWAEARSSSSSPTTGPTR